MSIQTRLRSGFLPGLHFLPIALVLICGCPPAQVSEDDLLREYFGPDPAQSFLMRLHMNWHMDPLNNVGAAGPLNYGARFFAFHKAYIDMYDLFRSSRGRQPVQTWDPATPIPPQLFHARRNPPPPSGVYPDCATPSWATIQGGTTTDDFYHAKTKLADFTTLDELGNAIGARWHTQVHNSIGGDMAALTGMAPTDPVFFAFHKWIEKIRLDWIRSASPAGDLTPIPRNHPE